MIIAMLRKFQNLRFCFWLLRPSFRVAGKYRIRLRRVWTSLLQRSTSCICPKAWEARYSYDADRRLLVPQYAGSRWGAVQQYKEEGELVYQDWWIRDVRSEDLEASPDTSITSFLNEDGNLTLIPQEAEDSFLEDNNTEQESTMEVDLKASEDEFPQSAEGDPDPFVPSLFLLFENF